MEITAALRSRRLSRRVCALLLTALLVGGCLLGAYRILATLAIPRGPDDYNIADWELRHVAGKWLFQFDTWLTGSASQAEQDETLLRFFDLNQEIGRLEASGGADRLSTLSQERDRIENQAEASLEARISAAAKQAGLTLPLLPVVWPPVDAEFTEAPRTLVTSRRDRIELLDTRLLRLDLEGGQVTAIEERAEANGDVSALAFPIGGVGAYPTIVEYPAGYRDALHLIAHEWTHNYLFFYPLGFHYGRNNDLRTINESVADLVAQELAAAVIERWPLQEQPAAPASPPQSAATPFDIRTALRQLRGEVDALLAAGQIQEAEALMEQRRQEFARQGFFFRRLNQAYFAFVNLYAGEAGSPGAVNPIGPKIDELRRRSASLGDFLDRVRGITSVEELDQRLREAP